MGMVKFSGFFSSFINRSNIFHISASINASFQLDLSQSYGRLGRKRNSSVLHITDFNVLHRFGIYWHSSQSNFLLISIHRFFNSKGSEHLRSPSPSPHGTSFPTAGNRVIIPAHTPDFAQLAPLPIYQSFICSSLSFIPVQGVTRVSVYCPPSSSHKFWFFFCVCDLCLPRCFAEVFCGHGECVNDFPERQMVSSMQWKSH